MDTRGTLLEAMRRSYAMQRHGPSGGVGMAPESVMSPFAQPGETNTTQSIPMPMGPTGSGGFSREAVGAYANAEGGDEEESPWLKHGIAAAQGLGGALANGAAPQADIMPTGGMGGGGGMQAFSVDRLKSKLAPFMRASGAFRRGGGGYAA